MADEPIINVIPIHVNHDWKNRRIDVIGDPEGYIITVNGKAFSFKLLDDFKHLDSNALYRFENTPQGIECEKVHVVNKDKEKWN